MRVRLLKFGEQQHELIITLHHIICDGWSINVLMRELTHLYLKNVNRDVLPHLSIQYADFAVWQRRWMEDEGNQRQLNYWRRQFGAARDVVGKTLIADGQSLTIIGVVRSRRIARIRSIPGAKRRL